MCVCVFVRVHISFVLFFFNSFENICFIMKFMEINCQMALIHAKSYFCARIHTNQTNNSFLFCFVFQSFSGFRSFISKITGDTTYHLTFDFIFIIHYLYFILHFCVCVYFLFVCLKKCQNFQKNCNNKGQKIQWKNIFCSIIICFCWAPPLVIKMIQLNWFKKKNNQQKLKKLPRSKKMGKSISKKKWVK